LGLTFGHWAGVVVAAAGAGCVACSLGNFWRVPRGLRHAAAVCVCCRVPIRWHQSRAMLLVAGSLVVAKPRSPPLSANITPSAEPDRSRRPSVARSRSCLISAWI